MPRQLTHVACGCAPQDATVNQRNVTILGLSMNVKLLTTLWSVISVVGGMLLAEEHLSK